MRYRVPVLVLAVLAVLCSCSNDAGTLRSRAEKGDPAAQYALGTAYANGQGFARDYAEAAKWLRMAAVQGHTGARFNLGVAYHNGLGVPQDYAEAAKWFRSAAEQGHPGAKNNLGAAYFNGRGVPRDPAEGMRWYRSAAEQDIRAPSSTSARRMPTETASRGITPSVGVARKAVDQGHADALVDLGIAYQNVRRVPGPLQRLLGFPGGGAERGRARVR